MIAIWTVLVMSSAYMASRLLPIQKFDSSILVHHHVAEADTTGTIYVEMNNDNSAEAELIVVDKSPNKPISTSASPIQESYDHQHHNHHSSSHGADLVRTRMHSQCTGKPQERRKLAALGNRTTKQQWMQMKECMERRERALSGIYALHVSKSGGM